MVERLENLKARATGNGVTQCLLCSAEFGLFTSKSYAAMCNDCRKYVCQRSCGVDTFDQKKMEPIFLCKVCSEYREVVRILFYFIKLNQFFFLDVEKKWSMVL